MKPNKRRANREDGICDLSRVLDMVCNQIANAKPGSMKLKALDELLHKHIHKISPEQQPGSAYQQAWVEQERTWKDLREWRKNVAPKSKLPRRTPLMDFAAGWNSALKAVRESVGKLWE